jgi:hypothetical protein
VSAVPFCSSTRPEEQFATAACHSDFKGCLPRYHGSVANLSRAMAEKVMQKSYAEIQGHGQDHRARSFTILKRFQYYIMRGFSTRTSVLFSHSGLQLISSGDDAEHYTVVLSRLHNCSKSLLQVSQNDYPEMSRRCKAACLQGHGCSRQEKTLRSQARREVRPLVATITEHSEMTPMRQQV